MGDPPFNSLTPDSVLDALGSIGLRGDGRLLALNSYENRVYQTGMEEGPPLIAKFYRPARWSDAQILEEHAFVATLAEREIPAVPALEISGRTLHAFNGFPFLPNREAVRPSWMTLERLNGLGVSSVAFTPSARWNPTGIAPRWTSRASVWSQVLICCSTTSFRLSCSRYIAA